MTEAFREKIRTLIKHGEGSIPHMYLDSVGKVTVGVGNMLPSASSASSLSFVNRITGEDARTEDIEIEFFQIRAREKSHVASYYEQFTTLFLPESEIDVLLDQRLDQFEQGLKHHFPEYDNYPSNARLGLMDMAFNLGTWGLVNKFPAFTRAAREKDWSTCARECRRKQIQQTRNDEIKALFNTCTNPETAAETGSDK